MKNAQWFEVDKAGLAKLVERRGKSFIIFELLQNSWDSPDVSRVSVTLEPVEGQPYANLSIEDDSPEGFKNLAHAYTLFAESAKKIDHKKRGRFNLGEKLVLALCKTATIKSTTGTVFFGEHGRTISKAKRPAGTAFTALVRMTREEMEKIVFDVEEVLPPPGVTTSFNGIELLPRKAVKVVKDVLLQTEIAGEDGILRRKYKETSVEIYNLRLGEHATLYEMGIPVVALGDDPYHVNVLQKIPVTMERDAVAPAYIRDVRGIVLDHMHSQLSEETARGKWAADAIEESNNPDAVKTIVTKRFGEKSVIYDPSDREANNIAMAQGFTVIPGGTFTSDAWDKIKSAEAVLPAGQMTPSPRPFSPDGEPLKEIPLEKYTKDMHTFAVFAVTFANRAASIALDLHIVNDLGWGFNAAYGKTGSVSGKMTVNLARVGHKFFVKGNLQEQVRLLIHELGHHFGHHLETTYHDALCRIGARAVELAIEKPGIFVS